MSIRDAERSVLHTSITVLNSTNSKKFYNNETKKEDTMYVTWYKLSKVSDESTVSIFSM
jgi:hypothetical protein